MKAATIPSPKGNFLLEKCQKLTFGGLSVDIDTCPVALRQLMSSSASLWWRRENLY